MVRGSPGSESPNEEDPIVQHSDDLKSGWEQTIHDARAMATDREENGFDTLVIPAGDTSPIAPDAGESDEFGLSYIIPGNKAEPFLDRYEGGEFTETAVYQMNANGYIFIITECIDLDSETVIFIAGSFEMRHAASMVRTAVNQGKMHTLVKKLDHTRLGTFEHDDVSAFFPNPDEYYAYETDF